MACNLKRIVDLPIKEDYKLALLEFFQKPENLGACEKFSNASDEEIMALLQNMEQNMSSQGPAPQGPAQGIGALPQGGPPPAPAPNAQMPPSRPQVPAGVPPGQLANTPKPMDIPLGVQGIPPRRM